MIQEEDCAIFKVSDLELQPVDITGFLDKCLAGLLCEHVVGPI